MGVATAGDDHQRAGRSRSGGVRSDPDRQRRSIIGTVRWRGARPHLPPLKVTKDPVICGNAKPNPRLVIGPDGGVANTYIFLSDIMRGAAIDPRDATIDQKACEYQPHAQVVVVGSKLVAVNSDEMLHSVHGRSGDSTVFNYTQPIFGQRSGQKKLTKPGIIAIGCDAGHIWMNAFVFVTAHPYYALTQEDGNFELANVPPGRYELVAWHEGWQTTRTPIAYQFSDPLTTKTNLVVEAGQATRIDLAIDPTGIAAPR
jgi:hypothetical protein